MVPLCTTEQATACLVLKKYGSKGTRGRKLVDRSIIPRVGILVYHLIAGLTERWCLQDQALLLAMAFAAGQECSTSRRFEDFAYALVGFGRTLEIFVGADLLLHFLALDRQSVRCATCMSLQCDSPAPV